MLPNHKPENKLDYVVRIHFHVGGDLMHFAHDARLAQQLSQRRAGPDLEVGGAVAIEDDGVPRVRVGG